MIKIKKISKIILFVSISIFAATIANAFGYFRKDYDVFDFMGMQGFGLFMGLGFIVLLAAAFLFVLWLWMLIDCLRRDFKRDIDKVVWILVMIFLHLLGAIIYYFVVKVAQKEGVKDKKK